MFFFFATWLRNWFSARKNTPIRTRSSRLDIESLELRDCPSTVWTDKPDYHPNSTALFSGSCLQPGETSKLQVITLSGPDGSASHEPFYLPDGGAGDLDGKADGNFKATW